MSSENIGQKLSKTPGDSNRPGFFMCAGDIYTAYAGFKFYDPNRKLNKT